MLFILFRVIISFLVMFQFLKMVGTRRGRHASSSARAIIGSGNGIDNNTNQYNNNNNNDDQGMARLTILDNLMQQMVQYV